MNGFRLCLKILGKERITKEIKPNKVSLEEQSSKRDMKKNPPWTPTDTFLFYYLKIKMVPTKYLSRRNISDGTSHCPQDFYSLFANQTRLLGLRIFFPISQRGFGVFDKESKYTIRLDCRKGKSEVKLQSTTYNLNVKATKQFDLSFYLQNRPHASLPEILRTKQAESRP